MSLTLSCHWRLVIYTRFFSNYTIQPYLNNANCYLFLVMSLHSAISRNIIYVHECLIFLLDVTNSCFINQPRPPDFTVYSARNRPRILNFWLTAFGSDADSLSTAFQWALDQAVHGTLSCARSDVSLLLPISTDCNYWFAFCIPTRAVFTGFSHCLRHLREQVHLAAETRFAFH